MKGKLFGIARAYMIDLFNEQYVLSSPSDFDPIEFDKWETEHVKYDYEEFVDGTLYYATIAVFIDKELEFTCSSNIAR